MSLAPISPAAAALRAQVIGAAESELIGALAAAQDLTAPAPKAPTAAPPDPVKQAIDTVRAAAAGRQASLAPLLADLVQAQASPALPPALRAAIGQVLALQTPLDVPPGADAVKQAVAQSGLFLEAHLAAAGPDPAPPDLKAALLTLQRALAAGPAAETAPPPQRIAPPARGGALTGQPPAPATLPPTADLAAIVGRLRPQAEQAVARQVLHQLASLPDAPATAWMFELPLATPQGPALAQFEIARDAPEPGADDAAPAWQVRFAIDLEPLGPLQVHLRSNGERAAVTIWAARDEALASLRGEGGELARALPADVTFRLGAPKAKVPARGRFLDRTS